MDRTEVLTGSIGMQSGWRESSRSKPNSWRGNRRVLRAMIDMSIVERQDPSDIQRIKAVLHIPGDGQIWAGARERSGGRAVGLRSGIARDHHLLLIEPR